MKVVLVTQEFYASILLSFTNPVVRKGPSLFCAADIWALEVERKAVHSPSPAK